MVKTKILMICLGNICRSPLAEGILRSKLDERYFEVDSAGTSNYHIGDTPDQRSIEVARKNGIDISKLTGRQFQKSDFDDFDYIFVMDKSNYKNIVYMARNQSDKNKVFYLMDGLSGTTQAEVPDPYYGDKNDFRNVFTMLNKACDVIARELTAQ